MQESWEEWREGQAFQGQQWWEREGKNKLPAQGGRRGKSDHYSHLDRLKPDLWPAKADQTGYFRTKIQTEIERQSFASVRLFPAVGRLKPPPWNWQKHQNENDNNLSILTPFSMILGLLESQQQALQIYAEKHHSPTEEDKTKWWKVWPLFRDKSVKNSKHQKCKKCSIWIPFLMS
jgi:hypothetical protein